MAAHDGETVVDTADQTRHLSSLSAGDDSAQYGQRTMRSGSRSVPRSRQTLQFGSALIRRHSLPVVTNSDGMNGRGSRSRDRRRCRTVDRFDSPGPPPCALYRIANTSFVVTLCRCEHRPRFASRSGRERRPAGKRWCWSRPSGGTARSSGRGPGTVDRAGRIHRGRERRRR